MKLTFVHFPLSWTWELAQCSGDKAGTSELRRPHTKGGVTYRSCLRGFSVESVKVCKSIETVRRKSRRRLFMRTRPGGRSYTDCPVRLLKKYSFPVLRLVCATQSGIVRSARYVHTATALTVRVDSLILLPSHFWCSLTSLRVCSFALKGCQRRL